EDDDRGAGGYAREDAIPQRSPPAPGEGERLAGRLPGGNAAGGPAKGWCDAHGKSFVVLLSVDRLDRRRDLLPQFRGDRRRAGDVGLGGALLALLARDVLQVGGNVRGGGAVVVLPAGEEVGDEHDRVGAFDVSREVDGEPQVGDRKSTRLNFS